MSTQSTYPLYKTRLTKNNMPQIIQEKDYFILITPNQCTKDFVTFAISYSKEIKHF